MKKNLLILPLVLMTTTLASCNGTSWSWWEENDVTIERYIAQQDASNALILSGENYKLATRKVEKLTYNTYYKNYLGNFSTETDSNIVQSLSITTRKYNNQVIVIESKSDKEESFLNASSVKTENTDTYLVGEGDKSITSTIVKDYGYGEDVISKSTIAYTSDEVYGSYMNIGSTIKTITDWTKATYGFSKNDKIIIETMATTSGSYTVKFNNNTLTTVTNTYNLYRLAPITIDDATTYYMDYSYTKVETLIGSGIFSTATNPVPLDEPYLLEKSEYSSTYYIEDNGNFDIPTIPTAE